MLQAKYHDILKTSPPHLILIKNESVLFLFNQLLLLLLPPAFSNSRRTVKTPKTCSKVCVNACSVLAVCGLLRVGVSFLVVC